MPRVRFSNGQIVEFANTPTEADIQEAAKALGIRPGETSQSQQPQQPTTPQSTEEPQDDKSFLDKVKGGYDKYAEDTRSFATGASNVMGSLMGSIAPSFKEIGYNVAERGLEDTRMKAFEMNRQIGEDVLKALNNPDLTDERKKELVELYQEINPDIFAGIPELNRTASQILGSAVVTGTTAASMGLAGGAFGTKMIGRTLTATAKRRILQGTAEGALVGFGEGLSVKTAKDNWGQVIRNTAKGAAWGAGTQTGIEGGMWMVRKIPDALAYISDVPEGILNKYYYQGKRMTTTGAVHKKAAKEAKKAHYMATGRVKGGGYGVKTIDQVHKDAVQLSDGLRKTFSDEFGSWADELADGVAKGQRRGLNTKMQKQLESIYELYPRHTFSNAPQNLDNMSFKEALGFYRELNALPTKNSDTAKHLIKTFRGKYRNVLTSFDAKALGPNSDNAINIFLKNYSDQINVLDNVDSLIATYPTLKQSGKAGVKQIQTAQNNLKNIYGENRGAYLAVIEHMEDMGRARGFIPDNKTRFLDDLAWIETNPILPVKEGRFTPTDIFRSFLVPFGGSPKMARFYTRGFGNLDNFIHWGRTVGGNDAAKVLWLTTFLNDDTGKENTKKAGNTAKGIGKDVGNVLTPGQPFGQ